MGNKETNIAYRLKRADETYEEALILFENKKWNAVVNRLYYSCFYAVIALLLKTNIRTTTHDGTRNQFGLHFIKTKKINEEYGKFYSKLFDYRHKGDYGDMFDFTEVDVFPLKDKALLFIDEIKKHI